MSEVVIVSGVRTAIGTFGGGLKEQTAAKLGAIVIKDVLKRVGLKPKSGAKLMDYGPKALAGGGLEFKSTPGQGTDVQAWFPLKWQTPPSGSETP